MQGLNLNCVVFAGAGGDVLLISRQTLALNAAATADGRGASGGQ